MIENFFFYSNLKKAFCQRHQTRLTYQPSRSGLISALWCCFVTCTQPNSILSPLLPCRCHLPPQTIFFSGDNPILSHVKHLLSPVLFARLRYSLEQFSLLNSVQRITFPVKDTFKVPPAQLTVFFFLLATFSPD